jgi:hypothetical protein
MDTQGGGRFGAESELLQRAQSDPKFRQQLLSNPNQAVQQAFGVNVPSGVRLRVVEETPGEYYIVLPAQSQGGAASDDALQAAAGDSSTWGPNCSQC